MNKKQIGMTTLALGALGVVFGDIGTSPLYALTVLFGFGGRHMAVDTTNVYGVISLIVWSVVIVVCFKYIGLVMRVGNDGDGGIMALVALVKKLRFNSKYKWFFIILGIIGVSLFYGDSAITPAISVLSAIEGLKVITPSLNSFIVPITVAILVFLFYLQRYGTAAIGKLFGPVMFVWFVVIGAAGAVRIWLFPSALRALNPLSALHFIVLRPGLAFLSMTAVILAITGAEALYADMGHFGREPIARAWFWLVFPALSLCYIGQGAVLLNNPSGLSSPFFHLFPSYLFIPAVILATLATLIASQSVISGAFSLTRQAVQLGFLPNLLVRHTSDEEAGQVYVPLVNILLLVTVIGLVLAFRSSASLAGAYGVAISGALLIDTILFIAVVWHWRHLPRWTIVIALLIFLPLDLIFVSSNLTKVVSGGWFPLVVAVIVFVMITTWIKGEKLVAETRQKLEGPLIDFVEVIHSKREQINKVAGDAIYIGHHVGYAPLALHASVEQLHELYTRTIIITVDIANVPHIETSQRAKIDYLGSKKDHLSYIHLTFGYHDIPNIPKTLETLAGASQEVKVDSTKARYFVSLSKIVPSNKRVMYRWQRSIYLFMARNRRSFSDHYRLPPERTIDVESVLEI